MSRFYPFKTTIDGKPYAAEWTILQGYRICVRCLGYVSESADIGKLTPQAAAARTLETMVRAECSKHCLLHNAGRRCINMGRG